MKLMALEIVKQWEESKDIIVNRFSLSVEFLVYQHEKKYWVCDVWRCKTMKRWNDESVREED
jgi:hypothetical protein